VQTIEGKYGNIWENAGKYGGSTGNYPEHDDDSVIIMIFKLQSSEF
jgi:hypothetical protein